MKYIKQFTLILFVSFLGEALHHWIPLPVPASIYGLILMFISLKLGIIAPHSVKETGIFLIEIMPIMFIPAAVGLLESQDMLKPVWFSYLFISLSSTIIVMVISGLVTQSIVRKKKKKAVKE